MAQSRLLLVDIMEKNSKTTLKKANDLGKALTDLQFEGKASWGRNLGRTREFFHFLDHGVRKNMDREERLVFPYLQTHIPKLDSFINLLCFEHQDFKVNLLSFKTWLAMLAKEKGKKRSQVIKKLGAKGTYLRYLLEGHFLEENNVLYKIADEELSRNEKRELLRRIEAVANGHNFS